LAERRGDPELAARACGIAPHRVALRLGHRTPRPNSSTRGGTDEQKEARKAGQTRDGAWRSYNVQSDYDSEASDVSTVLNELDISYHCKQYAAFTDSGNVDTAAYFIQEALENHSLVVKNALNCAQTAAVIIAGNLSGQAQYYILYGVARRLGMMRVAYSDILRCIATGRTEPLSSDEVAAAERDLNIIYINVSGVLDNYAWCLLHQITTDKMRNLHRRNVGLFSKDFMNDPNLADLKPKLSDFCTWHTDLKKRRDPAAHRIPLYVPPALLNPAEHERYATLEREISAAKTDQRRDELLAQQRKIGTFVPCFVHHPDEGGMKIYPTVPQDIANLIKIAKLVHTFLKPPQAPNA
jgi:hypothetical protein